MLYTSARRFPSATGVSAEGQIGYVYKLALSSDRRAVAVATQDRALRLIDTERLSMASQVAIAHHSTITDLQAVPSAVGGPCSFISASTDGTSKVWDLRQDTPVITTKLSTNLYDAPMFGASVSDSGTCAVSCGPNITLFKFGEWKKFFEYTESHFDTVSCLGCGRFGNQADILISGGEDGLVNVYNTTDLVNEDHGQCPTKTFNVGDSVRSFHLSPQRIFAFSTTESISVWDSATSCKVRPDVDTIRSHPLLASEETGWGYLIGMNQDCSRLLAGNSEGKIVEFDSTTFEVSNTFSAQHTGVVRSAVYLNQDLLLTAGEDGYLYEWTKAASQPIEMGQGKLRSRSHRASACSRPYY